MKYNILAFLLLVSVYFNAQNIQGINLAWFGQLQDITLTSELQISNISTIYYDDGTFEQATPDMPITWVWSRMVKNGTQWERTVLDSSFSITPAIHVDDLCNGIFVIELLAIHENGKSWGCQGPCQVLWNVFDDEGNLLIDHCPSLTQTVQIGNTIIWNDQMYLTYDQKIKAFTASMWYDGKDYIPKLGDLNDDALVNLVDLLIFLGQYGD